MNPVQILRPLGRAVALVLAAWTAEAGAATNGVGFSGAARLLEEAVRSGRAAGGIHWVVREGRVVHEAAAGTRDPVSGAPYAPDTVVRIYSMTKPVTSVAAMMLFEQGRFRLDDPVARFLPAFTNATVLETVDGAVRRVPPRRPATIRDVLSHTTGYSYGDEAAVRAFYEREGLRYRGPYELFPPELSLAQAAEALARVPALHHPGERFTYGFSTDLLGRLIEVWSGRALDVFLREAVFEPLGMRDTGFAVPAGAGNRFATCLGRREGRLEVADPADRSPFLRGFAFLSGGGGLVSTARDYARFGRMLAEGGVWEGRRLLREDTLRLMFSPQPGVDGTFRFGLGFEIREATLGVGAAARKVSEYTWGGYASTDFRILPSERSVQLVLRQEVPYDDTLAKELKAAVDAAWPPAQDRDPGTAP